MPTIADLTPGTIYQGNNGDKWIVGEGIQDEEKITVTLNKMIVEQEVIIT